MGERKIRSKIALLAIALVFGTWYYRAASVSRGAEFEAPAPQVSRPAAPFFRAQLIPNDSTKSVHSATAVEIEDGQLRAFWYGGSREGARDVSIYTSTYSPKEGRWTTERTAFTRESAQRGLQRYIRKLGNPVAGRDRSGRIWLFFVSVSIGGWAGSAINAASSDDDGETWSSLQRLVTSPFFNISTLVKGAPVLLADGSMGLPAYHEFIGKFGEFLRLDPKGHAVGKSRLSWGQAALQPVVVPLSDRQALALMRYSGDPPHRILVTRTLDAGLHWDHPRKTLLPNPNAAVAALRLQNDALLLAFNDSETDRENLSLAVSMDLGENWKIAYRVENGAQAGAAPVPEYSYPWLMQDRAGIVHLLYTWGRVRIKHVEFNQAWLERALR